MTTDRQRICKCGIDLAEFLSDIRILESHLKIVKIEDSDIYGPASKDYVNSIFTKINKIEDDCSVDANKIKWSHAGLFNNVEKIETIKDPKKFNENREDIIRDLDSLTNKIVQIVKDCSK